MKQIEYLITGSNGLLGQKIINLLIQNKIDFIATSKGRNRNSLLNDSNYQEVDLTKESEIEALFNRYQPDFIINTAALTNVDACEDQKELCDQLNVNAVAKLLACAKKLQSKLIHLSTDFIFDGEAGPYSENDEPNPLSYYGESKWKAEQLLLNSDYENWAIARTIIVYGTGEELSRSNIVLWAMDAIPKGSEMNIVNDQFRSPTFAEDLAIGCVAIAEKNQTGIFHLSGGELFSIYDLVIAIGNHFGWDTSHVNSISSATLNQKAKRPPKTGFDISKAKQLLGFKPRSLGEALDLLQKQLNS